MKRVKRLHGLRINEDFTEDTGDVKSDVKKYTDKVISNQKKYAAWSKARDRGAANRTLTRAFLKDFNATGYRDLRFTKEQELKLLHMYIDEGDQEAHDILIKANLGMVFDIARKWCRDKDKITDYVSEGIFGLEKAIRNFNFNRDVRLCTIAYPYVTKAVRMYAYGTDSAIVVKPHAQQIGKNIRQQKARFFAQHGRYPDNEELKELLWNARKLIVPDEELADTYVNSTNSPVATSEDDEAAEYGDTGDFALRTSSRNSYENTVDDEEIKDRVDFFLNSVNPMTKKILQMKFGLPPYDYEYDDSTIADELGVTSMTVYNTYQRALKRFREMQNL